jgi:uncharacterized protein YhfF
VSRDRLNALVLAGQMRATAGPYYPDDPYEVETVGERLVLLSSEDEAVALVQITRVDIFAFSAVPLEFVAAEGYHSVEEWRRDHRAWFAAEGMDLAEDTMLLCLRFRLLDEPPPASRPARP